MEESSALRALLHSSQTHVDQARLLIEESEHALLLSMAAIRNSERLIRESDLVIVRLQTLDCD
jgi:hypothetical protein